VRSALALKKKGLRFSQPRATACPPRDNKHTHRLDWAAQTASLSTTDGRQVVPFSVPAYAARYAGGSADSADLILRGGAWWLHAVVTLPTPAAAPTGEVVGVDLGLAQPAVTSTNCFPGTKAWRAVEGRSFKHRRALQSKGTRSARRRLRRIRHRQRLFRRDCDHVLSKRIVAAAPAGGTIVVENLTDVRARVKTRTGPRARRVHGWSFAQVRRFVGYKAEARGCTVAGVDPRQPSQRCSRCGHTARNNRRTRALFVCRSCGFTPHADANAARNLAAKDRAGVGTSGPGGHPVRVPTVSHAGQPPSCRHKPPA